MRFRIVIFLLLLFAVNPAKAQEIEHEHSIHHAFIENKGQWESPILFKAKFSNSWFLTFTNSLKPLKKTAFVTFCELRLPFGKYRKVY